LISTQDVCRINPWLPIEIFFLEMEEEEEYDGIPMVFR
jgi:hypothetical protein